MPELSRFFGIIIRMYVEIGGPHHFPHFHAYFQDDVAVVGLDPVELVAGNLARRQRRFVEAWAELHFISRRAMDTVQRRSPTLAPFAQSQGS